MRMHSHNVSHVKLLCLGVWLRAIFIASNASLRHIANFDQRYGIESIDLKTLHKMFYEDCSVCVMAGGWKNSGKELQCWVDEPYSSIAQYIFRAPFFLLSFLRNECYCITMFSVRSHSLQIGWKSLQYILTGFVFAHQPLIVCHVQDCGLLISAQSECLYWVSQRPAANNTDCFVTLTSFQSLDREMVFCWCSFFLFFFPF